LRTPPATPFSATHRILSLAIFIAVPVLYFSTTTLIGIHGHLLAEFPVQPCELRVSKNLLVSEKFASDFTKFITT